MYEALPALPTDSGFPGEAVAAIQRSETIAPGGIPIIDSGELFKDNKVVTIHHNGLVYRLQLTKLGKLILTK